MNVIQEIQRINERELALGIFGGSGKSWHDEYKNSAWVHVGGVPYELSEGDIICVMSQWGEVEDIELLREKGSNKSKGSAFVKYEDQRSTILAVDNFNGIQLLGRMLRVDHVNEKRLPKSVIEAESERLEENPDAQVQIGPGNAYRNKELKNEFDISKGVDLWAPPSSSSSSSPRPATAAATAAAAAQSDEKSEGKRKRKHKEADSSQRKREKRERKELRKELKKVLKKEKKREKQEKKQAAGTKNSSSAAAVGATSISLQAAPALTSGANVASWRGSCEPSAASSNVCFI
jgi:RNA-binding motif X-linked protein 2